MKTKSARATRLGRAIVWFPASQVAFALALLGWFALRPSPRPLLALAAVVYVYPLLTFRLLNLFWPLREGRAIIPNGTFPPWWGSFHVQRLFLAAPSLEAVLRLVPGLFSWWLRLWGSRIGRGVYWPPQLEIADRSLLEIGDGAVLGHRSGYYCHVLNPTKDGRILLIVKKVRVGRFAFIGSGSSLGPGTVVVDQGKVDVLTHLYFSHRDTASTPTSTPTPTPSP